MGYIHNQMGLNLQEKSKKVKMFLLHHQSFQYLLKLEERILFREGQEAKRLKSKT